MTARSEILEAARSLADRGVEPFSPADILQELRRAGTTYPESTLRTHIVSIMCVNAPSNHPTRYPDLERVGRGQYRLAETAGGRPISQTERTGRTSDRAERRDLDFQNQVLRALAGVGAPLSWPIDGVEASDDAEWQVGDLVRRGYVKWLGEPFGSSLALTRAGERAARNGLQVEPAGRRSSLEGHELELLHQLMWDAADKVAGEARRRHIGGIKWILEDHFLVDTRDGAGPQGRVRKDALSRLEGIGAIEQIGGGEAKRTGNSWVVDPGMVQYPW